MKLLIYFCILLTVPKSSHERRRNHKVVTYIFFVLEIDKVYVGISTLQSEIHNASLSHEIVQKSKV